MRVVCQPPITVPARNWFAVGVRGSETIDGGGGGQAEAGCWLRMLRTSFSSVGGVCAKTAEAPAMIRPRSPRMGMRLRRMARNISELGRWAKNHAASSVLDKVMNVDVFWPALVGSGRTRNTIYTEAMRMVSGVRNPVRLTINC